MLVFIDTEFTNLGKDAQLISVGAVSEFGEKFYAEISDYDTSLESDFVKENVIPNLLIANKTQKLTCKTDNNSRYNFSKFIFGPLTLVSKEFINWLTTINSDGSRITFVSDVCHYDAVLVFDMLLKTDSRIMDGFINPMIVDISTLIAFHEDKTLSDKSCIYAFNVSREQYVSILNGDFSNMKHNSIYDAIVIKMCFDKLVGNKVNNKSIELDLNDFLDEIESYL